MARITGYYYGPYLEVPAPLGGVRYVPFFKESLEAAGGTWKECWSNSDTVPLAGIWKISVEDTVDPNVYQRGGVQYLAGSFDRAKQAAAAKFEVGAANAERMVDQTLAGEAMEAGGLPEDL